ncbi:hypothetical protein LDENG_00294840, partial [Lucifuga dentata]
MALRAALRNRCGFSGLLSQLSCSRHAVGVCVSPVVSQRRNNSSKISVDFDGST